MNEEDERISHSKDLLHVRDLKILHFMDPSIHLRLKASTTTGGDVATGGGHYWSNVF